jgi:glucosamine-6-phosphate deaminase
MVYEELVRMHREDGLSFKNVVTFNLDEYYPMSRENSQSYWYFMHEHLFNHVDILPENIHIPDGEIPSADIYQFCIDYEMKIKESGGIDFQLLGIGRTGHIGFNEPGSHFNSGTRNITLDHITRVDAATSFLGIDNVPKVAITMGISTIRRAKRIVLLAWGINKAQVIKKAIEGEVTSEVPSTYLQLHDNVTFVLDEGASQ